MTYHNSFQEAEVNALTKARNLSPDRILEHLQTLFRTIICADVQRIENFRNSSIVKVKDARIEIWLNGWTSRHSWKGWNYITNRHALLPSNPQRSQHRSQTHPLRKSRPSPGSELAVIMSVRQNPLWYRLSTIIICAWTISPPERPTIEPMACPMELVENHILDAYCARVGASVGDETALCCEGDKGRLQ